MDEQRGATGYERRGGRPAGHPDNQLISRMGAHESWARTDDRAARTAPARSAFNDRFEREAREKFGDLPPDEMARRIAHLRKVYYQRLALRSAQARRRRGKGAAK